MASINAFIDTLGETGYIQNRTLGDRSPVTHHPTATFPAFDADDFDPDAFDDAVKTKIFIDTIQTRETSTSAGRSTQRTLRGFVKGSVTVNHLDHVTYHDEVYRVSASPDTVYLLGDAAYKRLNLERVT